jgi:hypothetical protein
MMGVGGRGQGEGAASTLWERHGGNVWNVVFDNMVPAGKMPLYHRGMVTEDFLSTPTVRLGFTVVCYADRASSGPVSR